MASEETYRANVVYGLATLKNELSMRLIEPTPAEIRQWRRERFARELPNTLVHLAVGIGACLLVTIALFLAHLGEMSFLAGLLVGNATYMSWDSHRGI
jgi:hypothetical protein